MKKKKINPEELNKVLRKIIMYMTLGIDVSSLFHEVCMLS